MVKRKRGGKPEESKTVRQWGILGRIPVEGATPSYIWDIQAGPQTVYFHEKNTREMTEAEKAAFAADMKGYSEKYLQMFKKNKDGRE